MLSTAQRLSMLECPKGLADVVLDSDAYNEIDDQFAIAYALKATDRIKLRALYAAPFLNERAQSPADGMEKSYLEIEKILHLVQSELPVFKGSPEHLGHENVPVDSPAARDLAQRAMGYSWDKPLYVVAIGAITNLASALLMNPDIAQRMVVVWLGGHALEWPDNREFNAAQDVAAARVVFQSGVPLVMLPCMGVVSAFTSTGPELTHWLKGKNALCDYLLEQTVKEAESYALGRVWSRVIWDVTAVGWLFNREGSFMKDRLIATPIPEYDHHYAFDPLRPLCRYVYHISRDALFEDLFRCLGA